jgi:hypothetical protein
MCADLRGGGDREKKEREKDGRGIVAMEWTRTRCLFFA